MEDTRGKELGWDDEVAKGEEYIILPEGDYDFVIESFERGRFAGSDKIAPCNKAILKLRVDAPQGSTTLTENLLLSSKMEWRLAEFWCALGVPEINGHFKPNWPIVPQATGRVTLEVTTDRKDSTKKYNHVKKWLPKQLKTYKAGEF